VTSRPEADSPGTPFGRGPRGVGENGDADAADPGAEAPEDAAAAEEAVEEILTDVAGLTAERDEYLAALQRAQADFANYRKRVLRQQEEQGSRAALDLVAKLLPVLDTLDLAVAHLDKTVDGDEQSTESQALRQARLLLIETLAKEGLERVDEEGVAFDPSVHDAVAHAPKTGDEDEAQGEPASTIEEVLRSGYRWRGQMLRPAMVRVRG
jgi:molecular chaperone GrpE